MRFTFDTTHLYQLSWVSGFKYSSQHYTSWLCESLQLSVVYGFETGMSSMRAKCGEVYMTMFAHLIRQWLWAQLSLISIYYSGEYDCNTTIDQHVITLEYIKHKPVVSEPVFDYLEQLKLRVSEALYNGDRIDPTVLELYNLLIKE